MSGQPHFVILGWTAAPGGTLSVLRRLIPELARHGAVRAVLHGPLHASLGVPTRIAGGRGSHPMRFPGIWLYLARMTIAAIRAVRHDRFAVLLPQDSLATGAAAVLAGRLTGAPVMLVEHGNATALRGDAFWRELRARPGRLGRLRMPLLRWSLRLLNQIAMRGTDIALLGGDEAGALYRAAGLTADRIARYHFPVDTQRFHPPARGTAEARAPLGLPAVAFVVGSVSRLEPEKGLEEIVDAAALCGVHDIHLVFGGDGSLAASLAQRAAARDVPATFTGSLDPYDVAQLLRACDTFVYAGHRGANTPYAVLEAMATGLPTIATDEPPAHRHLLANGAGWVVRPHHPEEIASALALIAADPQAARAAGRAARRRVEAEHDASRFENEIAAAVRLVAEGASRRRAQRSGDGRRR